MDAKQVSTALNLEYCVCGHTITQHRPRFNRRLLPSGCLIDPCSCVQFRYPERVAAEPVGEKCEWSWNARKEFWATGCGDALDLGGINFFRLSKARFCLNCGKEIQL